MDEKKTRVLVVEDEVRIARFLQMELEHEGFETETEGNGTRAYERIIQENFDIILLDVMLPGADGFAICRDVRKVLDIPILMVSARLEDVDKIRALGLGADDYIVKPFSPSELAARVKAHITRYDRLKGGAQTTPTVLRFGALEIQPWTHRVFVAGREVHLTMREFELLLFLAEHPQIVFSKETLYDRVWDLDAMGSTSTVSVHMNRLREKIEDDPSHPRWLQTVWGAGYRFNSEAADEE